MNDMNTDIVNKLEEFWTENKARGLLSEVRFLHDLESGSLRGNRTKYFEGCWLLAPKGADYFRHRFAFFVHPQIERNFSVNMLPEDIMNPADAIKLRRTAGFLGNAGLGVAYCVPLGGDIAAVTWHIYGYNGRSERLQYMSPTDLFGKWQGGGKRRFNRKGWSKDLKAEYQRLDRKTLISLYLKEHFYTEFIKAELRLQISDPYDIDGFLMVYSSGNVLPVEIKEKFPAADNNGRFFGIDAGRVLMLLRLCVPNNANALYVVREVDNTPERRFLGWKYVTLSDILMSSSWNLQKGGKGMGGQETQTIRLTYDAFGSLNNKTLQDRYLDSISAMPSEVKRMAREFMEERQRLFGL